MTHEESVKKYRASHARKTTIDTNRRVAKGFIRNHATLSDLYELRDIINKKIDLIKSGN